MNTKRVTIIINNLGIGGAERVVVHEINEMHRMGIDVSLITLRTDPVKNFASEILIPKEKIHCVVFKNLFHKTAWLELIRILKTSKPDLLITQLWYANTIGRIAGVLSGTKRVISFEQNVYDDLKTWKMYAVDFILQFFCTKVIAVSEAVKKSLIRHWILSSRIEVIYNCVKIESFGHVEGRTQARKALNNDDGSFVFGFVGRLIHQKAVDVLIDAFKLLEGKTTLVIAGQGIEREVLENQVKENGLEHRVLFVGVQKNIPMFMSAIDCFVLPSRYEGLPLVLVEALAAQKPIIVSDFEAAHEVIDGTNGLIVKKEDPIALGQAMQKIMSNEDLRNHLSQEAKKTAEKFSVENHVRAILQYHNIHP